MTMRRRAHQTICIAAIGLLVAIPTVVIAGEQPAGSAAELDAAAKAKIERLIGRLAADTYDEREQAMNDMLDMGPRILPHLRNRKATSDAEQQVRLTRVIDNVEFHKPEPAYMAKLLEDPTKRNRALFELLRAQQYSREDAYKEDAARLEDCVVRNVVRCSQPEGPPIYAVFKKSALETEKKNDLTGHLLLFDSKGRIVPVYAAGNSPESGVFRDINRDGMVTMVESWDYGATQGPSVSVLHVVPMTPEQKSVLCVAYNVDHVGEKWTWRMADEDSGPCKIQFGPEENFEPKVTFTWSKEQRKFVGPAGGPEQQVYQLETEHKKLWEGIEAYSKAHKKGGDK